MSLIRNHSLLICLSLSTVCSGQVIINNQLVSRQPSLDIRVSRPLKPVRSDDKTNLVYELWITNFSTESLTLKKVDVLNSADSGVLSSFEGKDIEQRFQVPGATSDSVASCVIGPRHVAVIYVELLLPARKKPPGLIHRLTVGLPEAKSDSTQLVQGASIPLVDEPAAVFGPPLTNGPWAAVYSPAWERGHRRVIFNVDGVARIPGRFAIDFVKLDENGQLTVGNKDKVANWHGYGADVLAVADGVVASTRTDFLESSTLSSHPAYPTESATGNYISLKIAGSQYVFYEHLQPASIRVKPGQRVKKGDVIARVGFTGQSTGPHLHLHLADSDSPLGAEGVPFVFNQFTWLGAYPDFAIFGKLRWQKTTRKSRITNQRPAPNEVIQFD